MKSTDGVVSRVCVAACFIVLMSGCGHAPNETDEFTGRSFVLLKKGETMDEIVRKAANVVPSKRQFRWQQREQIAFVHFGMNTFTDREWGEGSESPSTFNPTALDARQWATIVKEAGMRMLILTAKHHDGFCLWPSKYTEHSVKNSPWRNGNGDLVAEVAAACKEIGIDFGIYLSPWDRHEPSYGDSPRYNEYFRNQLRELLTNYGTVSEVWFDGACGEGPNGKRQVYDWRSYYAIVRELQPDAVIFGMGPDVRWVGTESGYGRETEWSVIPIVDERLDSLIAGYPEADAADGLVYGDRMGEDLGSREKIRSAQALIWYPAETDVSIRPGWFYHADQDHQVLEPEKLVDIYFSSVGRNGVLLLNIPPDKRGRIHAQDIKHLLQMRDILSETFKTNLAHASTVLASNQKAGHSGDAIMDGDERTYWTTESGVDSSTVVFMLRHQATFDRVLLQEHIRVGQRVESFHLEAWDGSSWVRFAGGTTIGYKRLLRFSPVTAQRVRLVIERSRTSPTLTGFGLFKSPS